MCVGVAVQRGPDQKGGQAPPLTLKGTPLPARKAAPRGRACVSNSPRPHALPGIHGARAFFPAPGALCQWPAARSLNSAVGLPVLPVLPVLTCVPDTREVFARRMRGNVRYLAVAT